MGIFGSRSGLNWTPVTDLNQLDEIALISTDKPAVIFKHSTRCGISRMVLGKFERELDFPDDVALYFLDLLEYRNISNEIADRFGIYHQSPQLILIKDGKVTYHTSHDGISASQLKKELY